MGRLYSGVRKKMQQQSLIIFPHTESFENKEINQHYLSRIVSTVIYCFA